MFYKTIVFFRTFMPSLTLRQQQVLDFIRQQRRNTGYSPSSREIQAYFGFQSQTAAMNHLRALEKKGFIERTPGKARSAVDQRQRLYSSLAIPFLGHIPAGLPVESTEAVDAALEIEPGMFGISAGEQVFALRVRGDSMIGAQIADGDTVLVAKRAPKNGNIVAALIDGEATLKRYLIQKGRPFLRAENPRYSDLTPATDLIIQGIIVGLLRKI